MGLLIGERNTTELLELRSGLEIYVARLAAGCENEKELDAVGRHLAQMEAALEHGALGEFAKADLEFHHALGRAAGNELLVDLLHVVRSLLQVYADRAVHDDAEARVALAEHEAVYRALCEGGPDAAASAMAVHMTTATERLSAESSVR